MSLLACNVISYSSRSSPFRKTSLAADVEIKKHVQTYTYNHADWPQSGVTAWWRVLHWNPCFFPFWPSEFKGRKNKGSNVNVLLLAQVSADPGNHSLHVFWGQMWYQGTIFCSVVLLSLHPEQKLGTVKNPSYEFDWKNYVAFLSEYLKSAK